MPIRDRALSMQQYAALSANPLATLQNTTLEVNALPQVADATRVDLWFAFYNNAMVIDQSETMAAALAGGPDKYCAIQRPMLVSCMRGYNLPVGVRHLATNNVQAGAINADLWVTEIQTGCSVLILDWGGDTYSMIHLQPSDDTQFNLLGRGLMGLGYYTKYITGEHLFRNAYKNTWLKQELTTIVQNTGAVPRYYILVQSMFEASRGRVTQVVGVKQNGRFQFFRQRMQGVNSTVQALNWCGWYSLMPYKAY